MKTRNRKQFSAWMIGLLALSLSACGESEVMQNTTPDEDPLANDPTRREIVLGFQNKLSIKNGTTRADAPIATADENAISTLDIYVFSSDKEEGPYTYQERFSYREDGTTVVGSTKIVLTMEGDNVALATLRPKKGLFTKFYCIANQPTLLKAGAVYDVFTPLEQSSPGADHNIVTKAGVPTETDFLTFTTPLLDPAEPTDVLLTPLPMVGSYSPALDLRDISMGSRTRINMTLQRIVSRFDIMNDAKKSHLTITSVSMGKGRKGVTFFPSAPAAANSYTPGTETPAVITGTLSMQKQATAATTSSMKLTVTAKGGSRIVGLPAWLKVDKATAHATEAIDYTFTLDQNAKGFPTGSFPVENAATFEIQNLSDATKKVEVTVKVTEP